MCVMCYGECGLVCVVVGGGGREDGACVEVGVGGQATTQTVYDKTSMDSTTIMSWTPLLSQNGQCAYKQGPHMYIHGPCTYIRHGLCTHTYKDHICI